MPRWNDEQRRLAKELIASGAHDSVFRRQLGRSKASAYAQLYYKVNGPRRRATRLNIDMSGPNPSGPTVYVQERPPEELIAEANARLLIPPRSTTAALCGDPLPGYSALDKRNASSGCNS